MIKTMYAVMAETHSGNTVTLRKGFNSRDRALDHPIIAAHWRKVWVANYVPDEVDPSAPQPWTVMWDGNRAYVLDARGRKIATLLGPQKRRETVAGLIIDALGETADEQVIQERVAAAA
jgi:hypothetical protein